MFLFEYQLEAPQHKTIKVNPVFQFYCPSFMVNTRYSKQEVSATKFNLISDFKYLLLVASWHLVSPVSSSVKPQESGMFCTAACLKFSCCPLVFRVAQRHKALGFFAGYLILYYNTYLYALCMTKLRAIYPTTVLFSIIRQYYFSYKSM